MLELFRLCVVITAASTIALSAKSAVPDDLDLQELTTWFEGSYSNERQAKQDSSFEHQRIEVRRIWMDRQDGVWFVMERFAAGKENETLRWVEQNVLRIHGVEENLIEVQSFKWKDFRNKSGLWKNPEKAAEYTPGELGLLRGCEMYLQRNSSAFFGGTHGMACSAGRPLVSYMNITISIADQSVALWERGYSPDNKQISGSVKGPYYYLKQKP